MKKMKKWEWKLEWGNGERIQRVENRQVKMNANLLTFDSPYGPEAVHRPLFPDGQCGLMYDQYSS